jgi:hypothetical protein
LGYEASQRRAPKTAGSAEFALWSDLLAVNQTPIIARRNCHDRGGGRLDRQYAGPYNELFTVNNFFDLMDAFDEPSGILLGRGVSGRDI